MMEGKRPLFMASCSINRRKKWENSTLLEKREVKENF